MDHQRQPRAALARGRRRQRLALGDRARRRGAARLVEVTGSASASSEASLPGDTAAALLTEGHSEIVKVLLLDDPPRVISCGTMGCRHASADELSE